MANMMKFLFASDSFKGSLSSEKTVELLDRAAREVFGPCETAGVPVADGGEGTVDAVVAAENGQKVTVWVKGPLGREIQASYGLFGNGRAVIEMAAASGLPLVPPEERNPLNTTSFGTGELIRDALDRGCRDIAIGIGGSATNDGGMGCVRALGGRFLDGTGRELSGFGRDLGKVEHIDLSSLDARLKEASITVMCDVKNPLCGPEGATYTFSAQKGATPEIQQELERGMEHYRQLILREQGMDCNRIPGAGAAGGLGAALRVFLKGELKSGIDTVLDLIHFDERLKGVDLVVTGEGRTDWQSCYGKVMQGVGVRSRARGVPVVGLSGSLGKNALDICQHGVASLMTTVNAPMELGEAMASAEALYYEGAVRMFRFVRVGMEIAAKWDAEDEEETDVDDPGVPDPVPLDMAEEIPVMENPAEAVPAVGNPAEAVPAVGNPAEAVPAVGNPAVEVPVVENPAEVVPAVQNPVEAVPAMGNPFEAVPAMGNPFKAVPAVGNPVEAVPAVGNPAGDTPIEENQNYK